MKLSSAYIIFILVLILAILSILIANQNDVIKESKQQETECWKQFDEFSRQHQE